MNYYDRSIFSMAGSFGPGKSTLVGAVVGALVGALVDALVGPLVVPLVGRGSLSPALCVAHPGH